MKEHIVEINSLKAKVLKLDSLGSVLEEFEIPMVFSEVKKVTCLHCNMTFETEPMHKNTYILEIGEYKYLIQKNGFIERIGHDEDGNILN
jgi:hypothetical protein